MEQNDRPSTLLLPLFTCAHTLVRREPPKKVPQHSLRIGRQYNKFKESHPFEIACTEICIDGISRSEIGKSKPLRWPKGTQCALRGTTTLGSFEFYERNISAGTEVSEC